MTRLEYMLDTYKFTSEATITQIGNNEFGNYIILNKTIFYPQGGGQPSDTGVIKTGDKEVQVISVRADEHGNVIHYISGENILTVGDEVSLYIDEQIRRFNARNHSAGHLLDVAVANIGYSHLNPTRGHHFPDGSYVSYQGNFDMNQKEDFIKKLQAEIISLVSQDIPMIIHYENLGDNEIPTKQTRRHANFEGYEGCGCGGTHVKSGGEIGNITIRKISSKKGVVKISYQIKNNNSSR